MNPPFKGKVDKEDIGAGLPTNTTKSELLFAHLILRVLEMGGRCAVIVPAGVLFGSSNAHVETRKKLIEENRLDGGVSMPSGVFKPYASVSTAVLFFTRGASTDRIWFYDMEHDGFSLDDKRTAVAENDIPDVLNCWANRFKHAFNQQRAQRLAELREQIAPLKTERLRLQKEIHRLTFEHAIAPDGDGDAQRILDENLRGLQDLEGLIHSLQSEINQLSRQFWVSKEQVRANKYDLSASRYRQIEQDEEFYDEPKVTLERLLKLNAGMDAEARELSRML